MPHHTFNYQNSQLQNDYAAGGISPTISLKWVFNATIFSLRKVRRSEKQSAKLVHLTVLQSIHRKG
jgi:hypothetical protein